MNLLTNKQLSSLYSIYFLTIFLPPPPLLGQKAVLYFFIGCFSVLISASDTSDDNLILFLSLILFLQYSWITVPPAVTYTQVYLSRYLIPISTFSALLIWFFVCACVTLLETFKLPELQFPQIFHQHIVGHITLLSFLIHWSQSVPQQGYAHLQIGKMRH